MCFFERNACLAKMLPVCLTMAGGDQHLHFGTDAGHMDLHIEVGHSGFFRVKEVHNTSNNAEELNVTVIVRKALVVFH